MADPNQQALEAWRASIGRSREDRLASMSPEREAWETQTPVEEVLRRRALSTSAQSSTPRMTRFPAVPSESSGSMTMGDLDLPPRTVQQASPMASPPAPTSSSNTRSASTTASPASTTVSGLATANARPSSVRGASNLPTQTVNTSIPATAGNEAAIVSANRNAARAAAAARSNTRSRPSAARGSEMSADDLNAMVLDRLGKSYEGQRPPSGASADEARERINSRMSEGMKKGGPVKKMAKGGAVKASVKGMKPVYKMAGGGAARGDGCAARGKTKGRMI